MLRVLERDMADWIYVATHEHMQGLVKIGQSQRDDPRTVRVPEFGSSTGVPGPYVCKYQAAVSNYEGLEEKIHSTLRSYRVVENREHFQCTIAKAISTVRLLAKITHEDDFRSLDELASALRDEKIQNAQDTKKVNKAVEEAYRLHEKQVDLRTGYILRNAKPKTHWVVTCLLTLGFLPAFFFGAVILIALVKSGFNFFFSDPLFAFGSVAFIAVYFWLVFREDGKTVSEERIEFVSRHAVSIYPSIDSSGEPSEIERLALEAFSKNIDPTILMSQPEGAEAVDIYSQRLDSVLELVEFSAAISFDELIELTQITPDQLQEILASLADSGRIQRDISTKGVFYKSPR